MGAWTDSWRSRSAAFAFWRPVHPRVEVTSVGMEVAELSGVGDDPVPEGYVCFVSSDGFEFLVETEFAMVSNLVKNTLESGFLEARTRRIFLPDYPASVIEVVCKYFFWKKSCGSAAESPKPLDFPPELSLQLLMAAIYLDT